MRVNKKQFIFRYIIDKLKLKQVKYIIFKRMVIVLKVEV